MAGFSATLYKKVDVITNIFQSCSKTITQKKLHYILYIGTLVFDSSIFSILIRFICSIALELSWFPSLRKSKYFSYVCIIVEEARWQKNISKG